MKRLLSSTIVRSILVASVSASGLLFTTPSQGETLQGESSTLVAQQSAPTLAQIASSNSNFTILTKILKSLDAVDGLNNPSSGPYTIFAPTDAAFQALPAGTVDTLLLPENRDTLAKILAYHFVSGRATASQLQSGSYTTVTWEKLLLNVDVSSSGVKVNDANVVAADVLASNGVIHVVDRVLIPQK